MPQTHVQGYDSQPYDRVRAAAVEALMRLEREGQIESVVDDVIRGAQFRPIDLRFFLQLVNGTIKMRRRLDHEIKFFLAKPSDGLSPRLSNILRLGFYQLLFTDRVPAAAAVSESVNLALKFLSKPQARLVNAVLRSKIRSPEKVKFVSIEDDPVRFLADYYSYPEYFVKYCLQEFGTERAEKLLIEYNKAPRATYRVNVLKGSYDEVTSLLREHGIEFEPGRYLPEFIHLKGAGLPLESELIKTGKVFVQDESAGLPVRLLNPKPGTEVVDLTAAPGGKATYAAIRMRNKGRVTAVDKSQARLQVLVENAKRLGIKIISPVVSDMADFTGGPFDRVLLDPPCSGWGTAGNHADLRWSKKPEDIENLVRIQTKMIDRAAKLVKPGGVLVYSTCTIIRAENDQVVEEFLLRNPEFDIESAEQFFDRTLVNVRGFVKTYPDLEDFDGAFCARLRRRIST